MNSIGEFEFFFDVHKKEQTACLVIDADCVVNDDLIRLREKIPNLKYPDLCTLRDNIDQVLALPCMKRAAKAHKRADAYWKDLEENLTALAILDKFAAWPASSSIQGSPPVSCKVAHSSANCSASPRTP